MRLCGGGPVRWRGVVPSTPRGGVGVGVPGAGVDGFKSAAWDWSIAEWSGTGNGESGGEPVNDVQAGDPGEIPDVVGHQGQAVDQGRRGDEQVEFWGRLADVPETGLELAVLAGDPQVGAEDRDLRQHRVDGEEPPGRGVGSQGPIEELGHGDGGDMKPSRVLEEPAEDNATPLQVGGAGIRVDEEAHGSDDSIGRRCTTRRRS